MAYKRLLLCAAMRHYALDYFAPMPLHSMLIALRADWRLRHVTRATDVALHMRRHAIRR